MRTPKLRTKTTSSGRVVPRGTLVDLLTAAGYKVVSGAEIRAKLGLPCFYCGTKWAKCKSQRFGIWKRCCDQCKGKRSHD